jgi:TolB-like protein/Flp pilus assembly protein TadD
MGDESSKPASTPTGAVFLSYASQDAEPARQICEALRTAGIEVWFDQSELRGGDAWDQSIRKQIKTCALFVPIISRNTHDRAEGYFRLEWKLAVDRCHLMAADKTFLVPIIIDDTPNDDERVPEKFREVQWTRLVDGQTPPEFVRRIGRLLTGEANQSATRARGPTAAAPGRSSRLKAAWLAAGIVIAALAAYLFTEKPWVAKPAPPPAAFAPPAHSIAVLPFVDMSEHHDQGYFADGLAEEVIDLLTKVPDLRVSARTSSFYFRDKPAPVSEIAKTLGVANVLEGSVRKSGPKLRVTAQLVRVSDGFHLWSETFDRAISDVFQIQDDIAGAVVSHLKLTLDGPLAGSSAIRTTNPEAYNLYLMGRQWYNRGGVDNYRRATDAFRQALALDPNFARALADLAVSEWGLANDTETLTDTDVRRITNNLDRAIALAPDDGAVYSARGNLRSQGLLDFSGARSDLERAITLEPSSSIHRRRYSQLLRKLGNCKAAITDGRRAVALDPLDMFSWVALALALECDGQLDAARQSLLRAQQLSPDAEVTLQQLAWLDLLQGHPDQARVYYATASMVSARLVGLAEVEYALGRPERARRMLNDAATQIGAKHPSIMASGLAFIGDKEAAFMWLNLAIKQHDGWLSDLKVNEAFTGLRADPRFQAVLRELNLPD